jgi:hypothetical protein
MAVGDLSLPGKAKSGEIQESVEILGPIDGASLREPFRRSSNPSAWREENFPRQDFADWIFGIGTRTR